MFHKIDYALSRRQEFSERQDIMIRHIALSIAIALAGTGVAQAEAFAPLNGRSANPGTLPNLSVEGAFSTGSFYQNIGTRVNYKLSDELVLFGDVGMVEVGYFFADADGIGFGIGAFYHLANQQMLPQMDMAAKASYHTANVEYGNSNFDFNVNNLSLEVLLSGTEPISANGLGWYGNAGLNIIGGDGSGSTEILLGGGVVLPVGPGEAYAGLDLVDSITFGAGFRYFIQ